ncbi:hypothetical protein EN873_44775 [bacterium M00.F.Ca.ET.230.01.1.1]|nr:hypothetical protein EN873_44775 [bacterium M00.F.Ca.ET.230.01.1.1]
MAIFHLNTSTISRKSGRTSTAAAAYRCGGILYDERTDKTHDYSKKKGVVFSECFIFENGQKVLLDRERVWNTAEQTEKRVDARTAREIIINLPYELDEINRTELVQEFTEHIAKTYNVAIDFAIHEPSKDGDQRNHHAHILMTTRTATLGENNSLVLGEKTNLELSNTKLGKLGLPKTQDQITDLREKWATMANDYLEFSHIDERIDHRSYAEQGIDKLPTKKLGNKTVKAERQGIQTIKGDYKRLVFEINVKRDEIKLYETVDRRIDENQQRYAKAERSATFADKRIDGSKQRIESSKQQIDSTEQTIRKYVESINRPKPIAPGANKNTPTPPQQVAQEQAQKPLTAYDRRVCDIYPFKATNAYYQPQTVPTIETLMERQQPIHLRFLNKQGREIDPNSRDMLSLEKRIFDTFRTLTDKTTHKLKETHSFVKDYLSMTMNEFTARYKLDLTQYDRNDIERKHNKILENERYENIMNKPKLTPTATNAHEQPKPKI